MSGFVWYELPDACPHCGGPLAATNGQTIIATVEMALTPTGVEVNEDTQAFWCGQCVEDWNARMAVDV